MPSNRDERSYYHKGEHQILRFWPDDELIVGALEPGITRRTLETQLRARGLQPVVRDPSATYTVLRNRSEDDSLTVRQWLSTLPEVRRTAPAYRDERGALRTFLPARCVVQFRRDMPHTAIVEMVANAGASIIAKQRTAGLYTIAAGTDAHPFELIEVMNRSDAVLYAEPDEFGVELLDYTPIDAEFNSLWALRNVGQEVDGTVGTPGADIDVTRAWNFGRGSRRVVVAVIDTGSDLDHADLAANLLPRGNEDWDFGSSDLSPDDEHERSHGTHVCGTVAATENDIGVIGVAPRCRVMPLRIFDRAARLADIADSINYVWGQAVEHRDRRYVVNCSWKVFSDSMALRDALQQSWDHGVLVVFAAANDSLDLDQTPVYPAVYPTVVAVAATDSNDEKASFSNYGTAVNVSAPGVGILSTVENDGYRFSDGTSMAAPHVSGVAALVWSVNPALRNRDVRRVLEETCDSIDAVNPDYVGKLGSGRVNANRATIRAVAGLGIVRGTL